MAEGCLEHLSVCNYKVIRDLSYSLKDERCFWENSGRSHRLHELMTIINSKKKDEQNKDWE